MSGFGGLVRDHMQAEVMLNKRVGCLPVVDGGRLVGLLSETDCLRLLCAALSEVESMQQERGAKAS